jgi:hypothetical protein
MSAGFMFLAFKKQITDCSSHAAGFSIFLNIVNTQDPQEMHKHGSVLWKLCPCLPDVPIKSARMCTIVTAVLQRQYLQTELVLWILLVAMQVLVYISVVVRDPDLFPLLTELVVFVYNRFNTSFHIGNLCLDIFL